MINRLLLKKIAVIGDIHCEDTILQKTVDFIKNENIENIFSTGDIVDGIGDINLTIDILKSYNIKTVLGNHDRWFLENKMRDLKNATQYKSINSNYLDYLKTLPKELDILTPNGVAILSHGIKDNDMNKIGEYDSNYTLTYNLELQKILKDRKYRYLIQGHSHNRMVKKIDHLTVLNAGSLTSENGAGFMTIDFIENTVQFYIFNDILDIISDKLIKL
ncbi:metallophosphoesterase family protein [bacterium]|nr:metallophosphoesterase family protein [bacterium]